MKNILIIVLPWFSVIGLVFVLLRLPTPRQQTMEKLYRSIGKKYILFFNSFNNSKNWNFYPGDITEFGPELLHDIPMCGHENCIFTSNATYLNNISAFDAILFNVNRDYHEIKNILNFRLPKQLYVFASHEPSFKTKRKFTNEADIFNITMTKRLDSDVPWIDYHYLDRESQNYIKISNLISWRKPKHESESEEKYLVLNKYKTKFAFYKGGRCGAPSERDTLIEQLQKYIEIDNYSECGADRCSGLNTKCQPLHSIEYEKYKFYFIFEEALYQDYISNEFFMALNVTTVPVVFGGANYELFAPSYSYIDANNFETIQKLANYLLHLIETPKDYVKYFWWKDYYTLIRSSKPALCNLCMAINQMDYKIVQEYENIQKWWYMSPVKRRIKLE